MARDPALVAPEVPAGLDTRELWYDLSPMRPDEFGRQKAARWERAERVKRAFETGRMLERSAAIQAERRRRENREREAALKRRMGG